MTMNDKIAYFTENYGNAFFVGSLTQEKTIYINKTGRELFKMTAETCEFNKIFSSSNEKLQATIMEHLTTVGQTFLNDCTVTTAEGVTLKVDLQIGIFDKDKTEIYMEMILKKDNSEVMSKFQVDKSLKAEAILELDETLTIFYKNEKFVELFGYTQEEFKNQYHNQLMNAFPIHQRGNILSIIDSDLKEKEHSFFEQEVTKQSGEKIWISFDIQKRKMGSNNNEKLMITCTNTSHRKQLESKNTFMLQQIAAMQELTHDILYHIDVEQGLLYHTVDLVRLKDKTNPISDYVNVFLENELVHPEDTEKYTTFLKEWYSCPDSTGECTIRASATSKEYQLYTIRNKKIFDQNGKLSYIMGALINIQELTTIRKSYSNLNQYFNVLQSISGESFFSLDVKKKTLLQKGQVAEELGFTPDVIVHDFPESVFHKVHTDDLEDYKKFTYDALKGVSTETKVRVQTTEGDFKWYHIVCDSIRDENGDVTEVVGKMNNIHKEKNLERENSTLNQYYEAVRSLSGESLYIVDVKTKILHSHGITIDELGLPPEVKGYPQSVYELIYPDDLEHYKSFSAHALAGTESQLTLRMRNKDRTYQWYQLNAMVIRDDQGIPKEVLGKIKNIQQQKDLEARASHDMMTKVLNKVSFEEAAELTFENSTEGSSHAIIFIDLDDFKYINDTLGHNFGDFLLTTVGKRLKRVVRENDLIGRLGGDEFAVVLKGINDEVAAALRVKLLMETLQRPFSFEGNTVEIKASIGFSIFPKHGKRYKELIKKADVAMYSSKEKGKNIATLYGDV